MPRKVPPTIYQRIVEDVMRLRDQGWSLGRIRDYISNLYGVRYSKEGLMYIIAREEGRNWKKFKHGNNNKLGLQGKKRNNDIEWVLAIGDLHLIQPYYTDLKGFYFLLDRVKKEGYRVDLIVLLGDVVDGEKKYWKQIFLAPRAKDLLNIQRRCLEVVIKDLEKMFPSAKIVIIKGNHEEEYTNDLLLDFCRTHKITYSEMLKVGKVVFLHTVDKRLSGSYSVGYTVQLIVESFLGLPRLIGEDFEMIIQGHIHKMMIKMKLSGRWLLSLPAFLIDESRKVRSMMYDNAVALVNVKIPRAIEISWVKSKPDEVKLFNAKFLRRVMKDMEVPLLVSL